MHLKRHGDGTWWIHGVPDDNTDCGEYATRQAAAEDMAGLERFFLYQDRPGFVTSEKNPKPKPKSRLARLRR